MMNNKRVEKVVLEGETIEDIPKIEKQLEEIAKANNTILINKEYTWEFEGFCQYRSKPKINKTSVGLFKVRSKDFIFIYDGHYMHGDIPKNKEIQILNNGFIVTRYGYKIKYTIID